MIQINAPQATETNNDKKMQECLPLLVRYRGSSHDKHQATARQKGHEVSSVRPDETVYDSVKKSASSRNVRKVVLKGRASSRTPVRDIMETSVVVVLEHDLDRARRDFELGKSGQPGGGAVAHTKFALTLNTKTATPVWAALSYCV